MSSKSRKNGLQLILLLRLIVEILSCYFLPTECLGTMGTQKITSFCTCVTHRFPTKKLLWKSSLKAFLKSTFAQLFYNPFYLFQVSMVLSAWKMAPLLRSKKLCTPQNTYSTTRCLYMSEFMYPSSVTYSKSPLTQ